MRNILIFGGMIFMFGLASISALPSYADEGTAPVKADAPKDTPKDASKDTSKDTSKSAKGGEGGEDGAKKKTAEDVSGGHFAGDPIYVHLPVMVLPVISNAGAEQLVTLQIDIEVKEFDMADTIHANMPRVMDALMRALYGGLGQGSLRNGKLVDVAKVKAKAVTALGDVLGAESIKDVLIEGVAQRML